MQGKALKPHKPENRIEPIARHDDYDGARIDGSKAADLELPCSNLAAQLTQCVPQLAEQLNQCVPQLAKPGS